MILFESSDKHSRIGYRLGERLYREAYPVG